MALPYRIVFQTHMVCLKILTLPLLLGFLYFILSHPIFFKCPLFVRNVTLNAVKSLQVCSAKSLSVKSSGLDLAGLDGTVTKK